MITNEHRRELIERASEAAAIESAVLAVGAGGGRLLAIEGPAGIGKSALIEVADQTAQAAGLRVLRARGGELEQEFGFGLVGQLFEGAVRDGPEGLLTGRASLAAPVLGFDRGVESAPSADAVFPALQGLYWLTVNLAEEQPLALLLDDVHLADSASIRFLAYLAARLDGLPVLIVVAGRSGPSAAQILAVLHAEEILRPRALTESGTAALVRSIAPQAASDVCRACHGAAGGNALFVRELARAVRDEKLERGPAAVRRLTGWSPETVTRLVTTRLRGLPADAQKLARALAVLGRDASLRHAAGLSELSATAADAAADSLRADGILAAGAELEFVHPIVRAAVHDEIAPAARARSHRRAAALLAAEHALPELVAVHLMHSTPEADPGVCATLTDAADHASIRGAPEAAATYLRRALREPPPGPERAGLLLTLAAAEGRTNELDRAGEHIQEAFRVAPDRDTRLQAAFLAGALAGYSNRASEAVRLLSEVRDDFSDRPEVRSSIEAQIANVARYERQTRIEMLALSQSLGREDDQETDAAVLASAAAELAMAGRSSDQVARVAVRGLTALAADRHVVDASAYLVLIRTLIISDAVEPAAVALDGLAAESRVTGSVLEFILASLFRADLMFRRGDVRESEADARAAYDLMPERRSPLGLGVVAHLVNALIERGELAEAESILSRAGLDGPAAELSASYVSNLLLLTRGRLRSAAAGPRLALEDLHECGRRQQDWGEPNPALICWRSEAALAHHALGQREQATRLAEEEVSLARQFGAPRAVGIALRAAAVVAEGDRGLELAQEAVAVLSASAARLEHARALAELGRRLLTNGARRQCLTVLRQALELAHLCGSPALERQIRVVLRQAGVRPRTPRVTGPEALTSSERRVAQMAAGDMTNREIAEALFVTVRTVEFHLVNAYRKLRIGGRRELRAALVDTAK